MRGRFSTVAEYESGEHAFSRRKSNTQIGERADDLARRRVLYGRTFLRPSQYKTGAVAKRMGGKRGLELSSVELHAWGALSLVVQFDICQWKSSRYETAMTCAGKILVHPALRDRAAPRSDLVEDGVSPQKH